MKTDNFNKAELYLVEFLIDNGVKESELTRGLIKDFQLDENESEKNITQYGRDFLSECHTERCEAAAYNRNHW